MIFSIYLATGFALGSTEKQMFYDINLPNCCAFHKNIPMSQQQHQTQMRKVGKEQKNISGPQPPRSQGSTVRETNLFFRKGCFRALFLRAARLTDIPRCASAATDLHPLCFQHTAHHQEGAYPPNPNVIPLTHPSPFPQVSLAPPSRATPST